MFLEVLRLEDLDALLRLAHKKHRRSLVLPDQAQAALGAEYRCRRVEAVRRHAARGQPLPMAPGSSSIPSFLSSTVRSFLSRTIASWPTSATAFFNSSGSGRRPTLRARRHSRTTGPTVTSKAPPLFWESSFDFSRM